MRPDDLTFAFSRDKTNFPYLIYNGLSGIQGLSVPSTKSYLDAFVLISFYSFAFIYLCIVSLLHYHLGFFPRIKDITFQQFCADYLIPYRFSREVLVPLYSGVCTCKESDILDYPAGLIVGKFLFLNTLRTTDYIAAVFGTRHYTIASPCGFKAVVTALTSPVPKNNIHISTPILRISGRENEYYLHSSSQKFGPFNHIILATPTPISSSLISTLPDPNPALCNALNKFIFVPSLVITHTDPTFIPTTPSLHRDLHFSRPSTPAPELQKLDGCTQVTHILHHRSPHLRNTKVYQTTNPYRQPREGTVLSQTWFERYLPTLESLRVRQEVFAKGAWGQGWRGIWFVGSWCGEGIPLLEGCVESAENVVEALLSREKGCESSD